MITTDYNSLLVQLKAAGIECGDTVLVHSSLCSMGNVVGGAQTVVKALLEVLGENGTLVAPAFCFMHEKFDCPIISLYEDKSEMGAISEAVRTRENALQSIAYRHSLSAVGKHADDIINVDPTLSVFDIRSSFGKMLGHNTKVLLLGVTYLNCTSHHFAEYLLQVPDREVVPVKIRLKQADGSFEDIITADYRPKINDSGEYYSYPHDFNRSGYELEKRGLVKISSIGNAMTRVFYMRDLIHYFIDNYSVEYNLFARLGESDTQLPDGEIVKKEYIDGAGRDDLSLWSCVNAEDVFVKK